MPIDDDAPDSRNMHPAIKNVHENFLTLFILLTERTLVYSVAGKARIASVD